MNSRYPLLLVTLTTDETENRKYNSSVNLMTQLLITLRISVLTEIHPCWGLRIFTDCDFLRYIIVLIYIMCATSIFEIRKEFFKIFMSVLNIASEISEFL